MSTTISVIMPARNAEKFIRPAIDSIRSQDVDDLELIVIDDGSTDRTAQLAAGTGDPRLRILPGPRNGISAAMNAGLAAARGQYIARCDADDLYTPGRLRRQLDWLTSHPDFIATCGGFATIDNRGRFIADLHCAGPAEHEITAELKIAQTPTHLCTFLVRTDALRATGGFRTYFETAEDIDLQLRLGEYGRVWYDPKSCYHYRLHDDSITHAGPNARRAFFENLARSLQAQRLATGQDDVDAGRAPLPSPKEISKAAGTGHQVSGMLMWRAWQELSAGHRVKALMTGTRACLMRPTRLDHWKNLALLAVKPASKALGESSCA